MNIIDAVKSLITKTKSTFIAASTSLYGYGMEVFFDRKRRPDAKIIDEGYAGNTDAYSIVKRISDNAVTIPPIIKEEKAGKFEPTEKPELLRPFFEPFNYASYSDWFFECCINLLNTGDLFLYPSIPVGFVNVNRIVEYRVLESSAVTIEQTEDKKIKSFVYLKGTQQQEVFEPEQIIHIKYADPSLFGISSKRGLSALQAGYLTLTADGDTEQAAAVMMKNKGAAGFITDESDQPLDPKDYKKLQKRLQADIGGASNFNKIKVTTGKYKFVQMGMSPADLKTIENQVLSLRKMCNLFSVNSGLFNDPANKTYNNQLEANKALYQDAVLPLWHKIFKGIQKYLRDFNLRLEFEPDISGVAALQADKLKEAQKNKQVTTAILSISENIAKNYLTLAGGRAVLVRQWGFSEDEANEILQEIENEIIENEPINS